MRHSRCRVRTRSRCWLVSAAWLTSAAGVSSAGVITVTTLDDVSDFGGAQQMTDLPGPDGRVSFREAVAASNNTPGGQTIEFAIPQSEFWLVTGVALLRLEDGVFQINDDHTVVDFSSQTVNIGDTNPYGHEVGIYGLEPNAWGVPAIFVHADHCTIIGLGDVHLRGTGVTMTGSYNRAIGCDIDGPLYAALEIKTYLGSPPAIGNIIGGDQPGDRNVLTAGNAGVRVDGGSIGSIVTGNTLVGSPFAGVEVRGAPCCAEYTPRDTLVSNNWIADNGSFGEEGFPLGVQVEVEYAVDTTVEHNIIGVNAAGDGPFPNAAGTAGVSVRVSQNTVIRGNVISGIRKAGTNHYQGQVFGVGVALQGRCQGTRIEANRIGVGADGVTPIPNRSSMILSFFPGAGSPEQTLIGGEVAGQGNIIAHGETFGVSVVATAMRTSILGNHIFNHGGLGIDIGAPGPTPAGAPTLTSAEGDGSGTEVTGSFVGAPGETYRVEFFANELCDASGFGEGQIFLGFANAVTNASGAGMFSATTGAVQDGDFITATISRLASGETSEFSACLPAEVAEHVAGDVNADGRVDFVDLNQLLSAYNAVGENMAADLDGDGDVDFADLNILLGNYNAGA